jgi:hypothetical protein
MKQINPIQSWVNGQSVTATIFNLYIVNGILGTSSTFYYSLADEAGIKVAEGNIVMEGDAYAAWGNDDEYAWDWAATTLNLTILGDYVPPVPPTPTEEATITE